MLTPWKESYDQSRQHIKKQKDYFANKGQSSQAMVFPVAMYGCESWTIKKSEHWRIYVFELWCWRLFFFNFNWRLITLQHCGGFCRTFTWISHGCTCVPHPDPSSHLPPHPIPQGHPSAPALSTLSHASNLDRWSILRMIMYMFQCYSLKSSHPRLLPQVQKSVLYICVSFAVLHIGSSLLSF